MSSQDLIDIIEHVNDDHGEELLSIAQVFIDERAERASLLDVNDQGLKLQVETPEGRSDHTHPFAMTGEAEDKILFLAYQAMVKQRKLPPGTRTRYFRFLARETLSPNMVRLKFATDRPLPDNEPGYAFLFGLKALRPTQKSDVEYSEMPLMMRIWFRGMLSVMKRLKPATRRKLLDSLYNKSKYYTLRASFAKAETGETQSIGWVDVFTHGSSPGSNWARNLKPGDMVKSTAEYREKTDHIHAGKALLIADETAMPALASVLEGWRNPTPPDIILISEQESEQSYIDPAFIPVGARVHRIVGNPDQRLTEIDNVLNTLSDLETAWGALEQSDSKHVRTFLRLHYALDAKCNRVRSYWKREVAIKDAV
ncbi:MAG: SIP domain-containing protein [Pseudomonadota bacterium]